MGCSTQKEPLYTSVQVLCGPCDRESSLPPLTSLGSKLNNHFTWASSNSHLINISGTTTRSYALPVRIYNSRGKVYMVIHPWDIINSRTDPPNCPVSSSPRRNPAETNKIKKNISLLQLLNTTLLSGEIKNPSSSYSPRLSSLLFLPPATPSP